MIEEPVELLVREPEVAPAPALPKLYVFAVGIAAYTGALKLDYADKNASVFNSLLQSASKPLFQKANVRLLTNEQATRKDILAGWTWLRREATQRDVSVFFYSGHGAKDEAGNFYFVPIDGESQDLLATSVSGSQCAKHVCSLMCLVSLLPACDTPSD